MILALRQNQMQKANQGEVIGHLVHKTWAVGVPMRLGASQVVLAQNLEVGGPQLAHRLRVVAAIGPAPIQGAGHLAQIGQFRGAFHSAVAGQYLFDQGGAGAGQPQDEYGRCICMPLACGTAQERGVEGLDDLIMGGPWSAPDHSAPATVAWRCHAGSDPKRPQSHRHPRAPWPMQREN